MDEEKQQGVDTSASFSDCLKICTSSKFGVRPIPLCQSRWQSSFYSFPPSYPKKKKKKKRLPPLSVPLPLFARFLSLLHPEFFFVLHRSVWKFRARNGANRLKLRTLFGKFSYSFLQSSPSLCPGLFHNDIEFFFLFLQLDGFFNLILSFMRYLVSRCRSVSSFFFFFFSGYKENILSRLVRKKEGYIRKF